MAPAAGDISESERLEERVELNLSRAETRSAWTFNFLHSAMNVKIVSQEDKTQHSLF